jgi:hypothetical protein
MAIFSESNLLELPEAIAQRQMTSETSAFTWKNRVLRKRHKRTNPAQKLRPNLPLLPQSTTGFFQSQT